MRKKSLVTIIFILSISLITACSNGSKEELEQLKVPSAGDTVAKMQTNYGDIYIKLFPEIAPKAVENFTKHAENGYYDGLIFHRVMDDFMIQGGDPESDGSGGESIWGEDFEDEFDPNYHNFRGALSMANSGPDTNGSQFFIVQRKIVEERDIEQMNALGEDFGYNEGVIEKYRDLGGTPWLDYNHTVFGQVYEGMDVVDEIASVKVDNQAKPKEDIVIKSISIEKYK